jgi:alpha-glucosidase
MEALPQSHHLLRQIHRWPEGAVVYHIYPRSLQDSDGDGIGDLPGIVQRLDYLKDLGVNALWLSPFYPSPMADFGYDISDYCDVHPMFGTLNDFEHLLEEAHLRDLKVIIDLVPNHTSDEHQWFKLSRMSKHSPYARWYIWKNAKPDADTPQPPNNWRDALTGESAWEWDDVRQQFYLHSFNKHQPDLNWSNSAVRDAMKDVMRFWLDLGVDGFRVDAVYWMAKDPLFRDDAVNMNYVEDEDPRYESLMHDNSSGWPGVYGYVQDMADVLMEEKYQASQRFMVTEAYPPRHNPVADYLLFYTAMDPKVAAPFNFEGLMLPWEASLWRRFLKTFHHTLDELSPLCVPSYAFGNHDQPRVVSRLGEDAARSAAVMYLTLPGLIFIYYGDEIGMRDIEIPHSRVQDPAAKGEPKGMGRDPARTPMQWSADTHAGFTTSETPWLPVAPDYVTRNVEAQKKDPHSFWALYKKLITIRNSSFTMKYGQIEVLDIEDPNVLGFARTKDGEDEQFVVFINFSDESVRLTDAPVRKLLVSSHPQTKLHNTLNGRVELLPHEGALFLKE